MRLILEPFFIRCKHKQNADLGIGKFRGGAEAKSSEPLQFIIEWLLENPDLAWQSEIGEAAQTRVPELYLL